MHDNIGHMVSVDHLGLDKASPPQLGAHQGDLEVGVRLVTVPPDFGCCHTAAQSGVHYPVGH